jgi:hypothetical protein
MARPLRPAAGRQPLTGLAGCYRLRSLVIEGRGLRRLEVDSEWRGRSAPQPATAPDGTGRLLSAPLVGGWGSRAPPIAGSLPWGGRIATLALTRAAPLAGQLHRLRGGLPVGRSRSPPAQPASRSLRDFPSGPHRYAGPYQGRSARSFAPLNEGGFPHPVRGVRR